MKEMAIKITMKGYFMLIRRATIYISNNPQEVTRFRENTGKPEPLFTTGENNGGTTFVRQHWVAATPKRFFLIRYKMIQLFELLAIHSLPPNP